jgi:hypothetical protein
MGSLPVIHEHVAHERVGDEMVLVHLRTNQIYALNGTGARFWELLAAGSTREAIVAAMTAEFDVTPQALEGEIDALVAALERAGMVESR